MYARSILYIGKEFMIIIIVVEVEEKSSNVLVEVVRRGAYLTPPKKTRPMNGSGPSPANLQPYDG
jgi:hypothetical protein